MAASNAISCLNYIGSLHCGGNLYNLDYCNLENADLSNCVLSNVSLKYANLKNCKCINTDFTGC